MGSLAQTPGSGSVPLANSTPLLCSPELDFAQFYSPDMDRLGPTPQFTDRENGVSALLILFAFSRVDPQRRRGLTPTMPACFLFWCV